MATDSIWIGNTIEIRRGDGPSTNDVVSIRVVNVAVVIIVSVVVVAHDIIVVVIAESIVANENAVVV